MSFNFEAVQTTTMMAQAGILSHNIMTIKGYHIPMGGVGYYYTETGSIELILTRGQAHCYPWHMHIRHWTIGVVRHGIVCLATNTASRRLYRGQSFFIRPYEFHSLNVEPKSSLFVICLDEHGATVLEEASAALLRHAACLQAEEKKSLEEALAACKGLGFPHKHFENFLTGHDSLFALSIQDIMRLILAKPDAPLGLKQMAVHTGYSPWHFLRTFQKTAGMTPHAFQLLCRLRMLRSLLRSDTAASTAAVSAGFADQSHMHKMFKRHHGMTPGEFKKASVRLEL